MKARTLLIIYAVTITVASFCTYFLGYTYPQAPYWDENGYIAIAQKYVDGVMFLSDHPPLGSMLIALGEGMIQPNTQIDTSSFTSTNFVKNIPKGYSFEGIRFFPVLFAWLSAILIFFTFYLFQKNPHLAALFSALYIFDNALIVHSKGAMLEGIQIFFILLAIFYFAYLLQIKKHIHGWNYFLLGVVIALPALTKITGLIVWPLFLFVFLYEQKAHLKQWKQQLVPLIKKFALRLLLTLAGFGLIFCLVWYVHFSMGKIVAGTNNYGISEEYKTILRDRATGDIRNFPVMLKDALGYISRYSDGVPKLDACKPGGENGSSPTLWPLGGKAINYRWEKTDDGAVKYMYLQTNPLVWLVGLAGIVISLVLIMSRVFFGLEIKNKRSFYLILSFVILYIGYMTVMLRIERVMYLYHYFIPLIFSFILAYLSFNYIVDEDRLRNNKKVVYGVLIVAMLAIVMTFNFFSPLTYYGALTKDQFYERSWLKAWQLKAI